MAAAKADIRLQIVVAVQDLTKDALKRIGEEARLSSKEGREAFDALGRAIKQAGKSAEEASKRLDRVGTGAERSLKNSADEAKRAGRLIREALTDAFRRSLAAVRQWHARVSGIFRRVIAMARRVVTSFAGLGAAIGAGFGFAIAVRQAIEFRRSMAEVSTITDTARYSMERMREQVLELARSTGQNEAVIAKGLYQAISAGIAPGDVGVSFITDASKLAIAGVAETNEAVDLLTNTVNAYKLNAEETARASDILFKTVEKGKTTIPELAGNLGVVTPIAAQLGVSLDELAASVATITLSGVTTGEAATQVRAILIALLRQADKADEAMRRLGKSFDANTIRTRGLNAVLLDLRQAVGDDEIALRELFARVEGLNGMLNLTGRNTAKFNEVLGTLRDSAGAVDVAFQKQMADPARRVTVSLNLLRIAFAEMGDRVVLAVADAINLAGGFEAVQNAGELLARTLGVIGELAGRAFGRLVKEASAFVDAAGGVESLAPIFDGLTDLIASISGLVLDTVRALVTGIYDAVSGLPAIFRAIGKESGEEFAAALQAALPWSTGEHTEDEAREWAQRHLVAIYDVVQRWGTPEDIKLLDSAATMQSIDEIEAALAPFMERLEAQSKKSDLGLIPGLPGTSTAALDQITASLGALRKEMDSLPSYESDRLIAGVLGEKSAWEARIAEIGTAWRDVTKAVEDITVNREVNIQIRTSYNKAVQAQIAANAAGDFSKDYINAWQTYWATRGKVAFEAVGDGLERATGPAIDHIKNIKVGFDETAAAYEAAKAARITAEEYLDEWNIRVRAIGAPDVRFGAVQGPPPAVELPDLPGEDGDELREELSYRDKIIQKIREALEEEKFEADVLRERVKLQREFARDQLGLTIPGLAQVLDLQVQVVAEWWSTLDAHGRLVESIKKQLDDERKAKREATERAKVARDLRKQLEAQAKATLDSLVGTSALYESMVRIAALNAQEAEAQRKHKEALAEVAKGERDILRMLELELANKLEQARVDKMRAGYIAEAGSYALGIVPGAEQAAMLAAQAATFIAIRVGHEKKVTDELERQKQLAEEQARLLDEERRKAGETDFKIGVEVGIKDFMERLRDANAMIGETLAGGTYDTMHRFFFDIASGAQSASEAFEEMGRNFVRVMADIAAQMLAKQALLLLFGAEGGLIKIPGITAEKGAVVRGEPITQPVYFEKGGVHTGSAERDLRQRPLPIVQYARGGVARSRQVVVFAEKPGMAEAFIPLPDGKNVPLAFERDTPFIPLPDGRRIPVKIKRDTLSVKQRSGLNARHMFADGGVMRGAPISASPQASAVHHYFERGGVMPGRYIQTSNDTVRYLAQGGVVYGSPTTNVTYMSTGGVVSGSPIAAPTTMVPLQSYSESSSQVSITMNVGSLDPRTATEVIMGSMREIEDAVASAVQSGRNRGLRESMRRA